MIRSLRTHIKISISLGLSILTLVSLCARAQDPFGTSTQPVIVSAKTNDIPRGPGALTIQPMTFGNQARFYVRHTYDPGSLLIPSLPAAIIMASPPRRYAREWKDGGQAFGRNFGDALAVQTAANTGKFLAGSILHEDPRYFPDTSLAVVHRIFYALAFTVIDRSTQGKPRFALSNFAGAAGGGFIGRAYLPVGFNDNIHAGQRSGGLYVGYIPTQLVGYATGNLFSEFTPEFKALGRALHIPFLH